jgi:hypothetical protein
MTCYERLEFIGDAILDFSVFFWLLDVGHTGLTCSQR